MNDQRATVDKDFVPEFNRDVKKLAKKYPHFEMDLQRALKVITADPFTTNSKRISDLGKDVSIPVFKLKKFRSIDINHKGAQSGFRLIYAYCQEENKIYLIQAYHKRKQANHDVNRIKKYFEIKDEEGFVNSFQAS